MRSIEGSRVLFGCWLIAAVAALGCGSEAPSTAAPPATASVSAVAVTATSTTGSAAAPPEAAGTAPLPPLADDGPLEDAPYRGEKMGKPLFWCGTFEWYGEERAYGHVIDDTGRVWFLNFGRAWTEHPRGELHQASVLEARFKYGTLQTRRVPLDLLPTLRDKAARAKTGSVRWEMRPAGHLHPSVTSCEAYVWEQPDVYRRVELGQAGEVSGQHSAPEANELWGWLTREVGMGFRRAAPRRPPPIRIEETPR